MYNPTYTFKFVVMTSDKSDSIRFIVRFADSYLFNTLSEYVSCLSPRQKSRLRSFTLRHINSSFAFYTLWSRLD